jgi:hypothetical protein
MHRDGGGSVKRHSMIGHQIEFPLHVAICAWCRPHELGEGLGAISHGICLGHLRGFVLQLKGFLPTPAETQEAAEREENNHWHEGLLPF